MFAGLRMPILNLSTQLDLVETNPPAAREEGRTSPGLDGEAGTTAHIPPVPPLELAQLMELSKKLGFVVQPLQNFKREFQESIVSRLKMREGTFVHQSAAYSLPNYPRAAAERLFPPPPHYVRVRGGADVEHEHDEQRRGLPGRDDIVAFPVVNGSVTRADQAIRAGDSCASDGCCADGVLLGRRASRAAADDGTSERYPCPNFRGRQAHGRERLRSVCGVVETAGARGESVGGGDGSCAAEAHTSGPAADERGCQASTRVYSGGGEGDGQSAQVVPGEVGGVSPLVGSVESSWGGGQSVGDVGAGGARTEDRGMGDLAGVEEGSGGASNSREGAGDKCGGGRAAGGVRTARRRGRPPSRAPAAHPDSTPSSATCAACFTPSTTALVAPACPSGPKAFGRPRVECKRLECLEARKRVKDNLQSCRAELDILKTARAVERRRVDAKSSQSALREETLRVELQ
eukprot:1569112-Pleurochrysis_carterae.AAC.1